MEIFCDIAFIACEGDFNADIICQYGDGPEQVIPAAEVLRRFLEHHETAPQALRDLYGVAYLVQDLAFRDQEEAVRRINSLGQHHAGLHF